MPLRDAKQGHFTTRPFRNDFIAERIHERASMGLAMGTRRAVVRFRTPGRAFGELLEGPDVLGGQAKRGQARDCKGEMIHRTPEKRLDGTQTT